MEFLDSVIGLLVSHSLVNDHLVTIFAEALVISPFHWVALLDWDVLDCAGEVNQEEINVIETKVSQRLLAGLSNVLRAVESIPKFSSDEEVFSLHNTLINSSLDTLTSFDFVKIDGSGIDAPVASLDGLVDAISGLRPWDLPDSEAD